MISNKLEPHQNRLSFGMALNVNLSEIKKVMGKQVASEVEKSIPELKELAKGVDMYISAERSDWCRALDKISITAQNIITPFVESKNPIINYTRKFKYERKIANNNYSEGNMYNPFNIKKNLVQLASEVKNSLKIS